MSLLRSGEVWSQTNFTEMYLCVGRLSPSSKDANLINPHSKNLDSHLRPYRCKADNPDCQEKAFSSNAVLFRHEREAHGLHGHGDNPWTCAYDGCERRKHGNGFPRKWNLYDHMRRVHGHSGEECNDQRASVDVHRKRKGATGSKSVPMKRSTSSQLKAKHASASYSKDSRHAPTLSRPEPLPVYSGDFSRNCYTGSTYPVSRDNIRYSQVNYAAPRNIQLAHRSILVR